MQINRQRVSRYFKSPNFSLSLDLGSWRISKLEKTISDVLKNALSRHYETLELAHSKIFQNIFRLRGQENLQNTTVNINLYRR